MRARGLLLAFLVVAAAGCGQPDAASDGTLTVFAASSLSEVFPLIEPDAVFQFAGSDELALQIREGASADVFAGASPAYAAMLFEEELVEEPRAFATNKLVLIVPQDNPAGIVSLSNLARPGTRLVIGAPGVPAGDYARELLADAGAEDVLERVVSEEESVKAIVGKVALGEADAGFVYTTDAAAAGNRVTAIALPEALQPDIRYTLAAVAGTEHRDAAVRFITEVTGPTGRAILRDAGFGLP